MATATAHSWRHVCYSWKQCATCQCRVPCISALLIKYFLQPLLRWSTFDCVWQLQYWIQIYSLMADLNMTAIKSGWHYHTQRLFCLQHKAVVVVDVAFGLLYSCCVTAQLSFDHHGHGRYEDLEHACCQYSLTLAPATFVLLTAQSRCRCRRGTRSTV